MEIDFNFSSQIIEEHVGINPSINDKEKASRLHFFGKLLETIFVQPIISTGTLIGRSIKLITWDIAKAGVYKISGYHTESADFLEGEYLKTVKVFRDLLFIPSVALRAFLDLVMPREDFIDDIDSKSPENYINVEFTKSFQQFSSYMHGCATFEVLHPEGITEFPAVSDPSLKTVMASHIFKPGMMGIIFGTPNVATFVTEEKEDSSVQTTKVDAKSLWREPMGFHPTNGKIQTGVFFVPTNLPDEALERFNAAAQKLAGSTNVTCVNTNCRVLQEAGFSIEGVSMDGVILPGELVDHLLFRNVFYTGIDSVKHKVHFDILNTTQQPLEKFFENVDTAVVGTRLRHRRRHADTEEAKNARGEMAKRLITDEVKRLAEAEAESVEEENRMILAQRKVTISVPSCIADSLASIWGRHTMYEMDLTDKQVEISEAFNELATEMEGETAKLRPFPQENPSWATWLKKNIFFSDPMIQFLRRHMMGNADVVHLSTLGIFQHLKSMQGERLNYVLLEDKLVVAKVHANGSNDGAHEKAADWALSKHALLAGREDVYCSGEIWYDEAKERFMMNGDSGTYTPSFERVQVVVTLANNILGDAFEAVQEGHEETSEGSGNLTGDEDVDSI